MIRINNLRDFIEAINHPYRYGEYFTNENNQVIQVPTSFDEVEEILNENKEIYYDVNWEDNNLFAESGEQIKSVY